MSDDREWLAGWYAKRLHAASGHGNALQSACGAWVYRAPQSEAAAKSIKRGLLRCRRCERILGIIKRSEACGGDCAMTAATTRIINRLRRAHAKLQTYHSLSGVVGDEFSDTLQMREMAGVDYHSAMALEINNVDRDPDEMRAKAEFLRLLWNHWPDILSALRQMERRAAGEEKR